MTTSEPIVTVKRFIAVQAGEMWEDKRFCPNGHLVGWVQRENDEEVTVSLLRVVDKEACSTCGWSEHDD